MNSQYRQRILKLIEETIHDGEELSKMPWPTNRIEDKEIDEKYSRKNGVWEGKLNTLFTVMKGHLQPWYEGLTDGRTDHQIGTLYALKHAIENDWLTSVENLVVAEAFTDLLEQADYLLEKSFHVAAGTLGRAVLEEHLRKWCGRSGCVPTKKRPTLADFNMELYTKNHITKVTHAHVLAMIAIGNQAAHNEKVTVQEVERLLRDVRGFLQNHPLP
jgi:hypothetical protein